jgi:hypothetical protein
MKLACLVLYALALASLAGLLPANWRIVATIAAVGLVAHTLEILFVFKYVRRYQGPLASSVLLTLLFGFLHWKPIADRAKTGAG